jgi:hypothetical protein
LAAFCLRGRAAVAVVGGGTVIRWWRFNPSSLLSVGRVVTGCVLFFWLPGQMVCDDSLRVFYFGCTRGSGHVTGVSSVGAW